MAYTTPNQTYYSQITNEVQAGMGRGNNILGELGKGVLPTVGIAGLQGAATQQQMTLVGTELGLSNAYQTAMAGYQTGQLGIRGQQIGLSQLGTRQEQQLQHTILNPLEQQQFAISQQRYGTERAQAALNHRNTLLQTQGQLASGGAQGTTGGKEELTTIAKQYGFQLKTIARQQQLSQLGQVGTLAQQKYSTEQLNNAQQNLALLAKSNGLSQQEVLTRLNYAISQGQLGAESTVIGLLTKLGGIWAGAAARVGQTVGMGGFITGINLYSPPVTGIAGGTISGNQPSLGYVP